MSMDLSLALLKVCFESRFDYGQHRNLFFKCLCCVIWWKFLVHRCRMLLP